MSDLVIWVAIGVLLSHQTINPLIADGDGRGQDKRMPLQHRTEARYAIFLRGD
jgi:hypothetical protein